MLLFVVAVIAGLVVLPKAADHFVLGAARIAGALRVSPVVIGAVVVGFGTSAPEMLVSALAAGQEELDIAVGNIVGSNLANVTLVLGIAALVTRIGVSSRTLRREAPLSVGSVIVFAALLQGGLERVEGLVLAAALVGSLAWILRDARTGGDEELVAEVGEYVDVEHPHPVGREAVRTAIGLVLTLGAAQALVHGASGIAEELGIGSGFIGVTLVAVGTSLPELVTSVQAARRGEDELIVGNLLGSNLFNSLAVGGIAALVGPGSVEDATLAGLGAGLMVTVAILSAAFMATRREVVRWESVALLGVYGATLPLLAT